MVLAELGIEPVRYETVVGKSKLTLIGQERLLRKLDLEADESAGVLEEREIVFGAETHIPSFQDYTEEELAELFARDGVGSY